MSVNTNRRALLAAPLALPLIAFPAPTIAAPVGITPALASLIAAYVATEAEYDRWCDEVHNPAIKRQDAMVAAIPHFEIDATLARDGSRVWSTATGGIGEARGIATIPKHLHSTRPDWQDKVRRARTFTAAYLRRERAIGRTHKPAGLDAVEAQEKQICARLDSARRAIFDFPARTASDLRGKLETLDEWLTHAEMKGMTLADLDSIQSGDA